MERNPKTTTYLIYIHKIIDMHYFKDNENMVFISASVKLANGDAMTNLNPSH
jgi:hypothetical protein